MSTDPQTNRFRKLPVEIEARQWDGTADGATRIIDWVLSHGSTATYTCSNPDRCAENDGDTPHYIKIHTLEGTMSADLGDWIIRGIQGEFYPCKPSIFEQTYEPAAPSAPADRAGLRERIAGALYRHEWPGKQIWQQALAMDREAFLAQADAVLSVLPPAADRASVLREGADAVAADTEVHIRYGSATDYANRHAALLRRLADEAQRCPHGCDISHCPCLACEAEQAAVTLPGKEA